MLFNLKYDMPIDIDICLLVEEESLDIIQFHSSSLFRFSCVLLGVPKLDEKKTCFARAQNAALDFINRTPLSRLQHAPYVSLSISVRV